MQEYRIQDEATREFLSAFAKATANAISKATLYAKIKDYPLAEFEAALRDVEAFAWIANDHALNCRCADCGWAQE